MTAAAVTVGVNAFTPNGSCAHGEDRTTKPVRIFGPDRLRVLSLEERA